MSKEEGKQKRIEDGYWKLMGLNEDRIAIVNAPILHFMIIIRIPLLMIEYLIICMMNIRITKKRLKYLMI